MLLHAVERDAQIEPASLRARLVRAFMGTSGCVLSAVGHRGYWHLCRAAAAILSGDERCTIRFAEDALFRCHLADPYWNRLVSRCYCYEPEIGHVLSRLRTSEYVFIDCGANYGFWSVLVTSRRLGAKKAIAVEPNPDTYRMLCANNLLNGNRIVTMQRALASRSGQSMIMHGDVDHASASVRPPTADHLELRGQPVLTISLDDLADEFAPGVSPIVLKLDVEGSEIDALKGAARLLSRPTLIIYEDHGRDRSCMVSRFIHDELCMRVFFVGSGGAAIEMTDTNQILARKKRVSKGYNFFAFNAGYGFFSHAFSS